MDVWTLCLYSETAKEQVNVLKEGKDVLNLEMLWMTKKWLLNLTFVRYVELCKFLRLLSTSIRNDGQ